ncbi:primase-helicase zinc-binding domain-containing protein [Oenococcus sp.]|uniref:primase-helicase zinc-binding domain-containing protein n=1 Tax=Oenococcus sp. TaxID=1979414 RepID=UPI0039E9FD15
MLTSSVGRKLSQLMPCPMCGNRDRNTACRRRDIKSHGHCFARKIGTEIIQMVIGGITRKRLCTRSR